MARKATLLILLIFCYGEVLIADERFHDEIFYEIWVKSFADSEDPDHIGDIRGIINKLDYLEDLGVTALKLSPIFECGYSSNDPYANMHGYDTVDYYRINPLFGTREDVRGLLDKAHAKGMKVIFDFVPNHTSNKHPWFINASQGGNKRDWYVWDDNPDISWRIPWGGGKSWEDVWLSANGSYYYSAFQFKTLPDLNYKNPAVAAEMLNVVKYWLDFGFDGLRIDAARYLVEDGPGKAADRPGTHTFFKKVRSLLDRYPKPKVMIAESFTLDPAIVRSYYGNGKDEFHYSFDFPFAFETARTINNQDATGMIKLLQYQMENYPAGCRPATFLENHDNVNPRPYTLYGKDLRKCLLAAALNLFTYGTPFIYYGDEIGLEGGKGRGQDQDILLRKYFNWDAAGEQSADPSSLFNRYKRMIAVRRKHQAITRGDLEIITCKDKSILPLVRTYQGEVMLIVFNVSGKIKRIELDLSSYTSGGKSIFPIIGDYPKLAPFSFSVATIGGHTQEKIANWKAPIIGGATEPALVSIQYPTVFVRGTMNDWKGSPMRRKAGRIWSLTKRLEQGEHRFKFETGGREIWEINWGDTNQDKTCEVDGMPIIFQIVDAGYYEILFNEEDFSYKVIQR